MNTDIPTSMPQFGPFDKQWSDRRLLMVNHYAFATGAKVPVTIKEHQARREAVRQHVRFVSGLDRVKISSAEITPSNPRCYESVIISDIDTETIPGLRLTGNLYMPEKISGKIPALLCPHGHWENGRVHHDERGGVVMRCLQFARLGFAVFSPDMIGYNDNNDLPHHFRGDFKKRADLAGISPFALQLLNNIRAIDFLASLPEVDPEKIGCTGASGGGTQTWFLALMDERIKAAAPVCMLSSHFQGGCGCEEGSLLRIDGLTNFDVVSALAPMPVMLPSVTRDWTNLNPDYEIPKLQAIYNLYGARDKVYNFHCDAPHNYNRNSREHVYSFFLRELLGKTDVPEILPEDPIAPPPPEMLWHKGTKPVPATDESAEKTLQKLVREYTSNPADAGTLQNILRVDTDPQDVVERVTCPFWQHDNALSHMRLISRRDVGDFIFAVKTTPQNAEKNDTVLLFIAPDSYKEFFDNAPYAALLKQAVVKGITAYTSEMLGTGETAAQLAVSPRNDLDSQDMTFNPSYFSMRVQDIITLRSLLLQRGFSRVIAVAPAKSALTALAASILTGMELIADISALDDAIWMEKLNFQPHILKTGGVAGLKELCDKTKVTFCTSTAELIEATAALK